MREGFASINPTPNDQINTAGHSVATGLAAKALYLKNKGGSILNMMSKEQAKEFALKWLPAWTGNDPERLLSYYSDDAFYLDPTIPNGVEGKEKLRLYFNMLLSNNPNWVWTQIEGIPMEAGFLNKWHALMPVGPKNVECIGVCFVQFNGNGKIRRNEVYFDTKELISEIRKYNKGKKQ